jgi:chromosome segregation ATPase
LANKIIAGAEYVTTNPALNSRLKDLQESNEELFKKNTTLQETINYLGEENRRLVSRLNSLSNQLVEANSKADRVQISLAQLERYQQIEDIVKSRINNNT